MEVMFVETSAAPLPNKRVSGDAVLRPNPSLSLRTSDTRNVIRHTMLQGG